MSTTLIMILLPVLFIFIGTIAALSVTRGTSHPESYQAKNVSTDSMAKRIVPDRPTAILFQPSAKPTQPPQEVAMEDLLIAIETHIRNEREAAHAFTRDPSAQTLSLN
ncbi:MAG: hypothetical protein M5R36_07285 [Deltaproteobacteria bacterium]|nr:hypothetical protein [Deltaproteobacteria bacterium]